VVDLSKAKKGDKVKFRCGGEAVIQDRKANTLFFNGEPEQQACNWYWDGRFITMGRENIDHPFDITSIEPPAFDWSTVKAGMAFSVKGRSGVGIYIANSIRNKEAVVLDALDLDGAELYEGYSKEYLIRAPEHDIEVTP